MESLRRSWSSISGGFSEESKEGEKFSNEANCDIIKAIPACYGNNGSSKTSSNQYADLDSLELGRSQELFKSSLLAPGNPRTQKLLRTHVIREDKWNFYMYDDNTNRFMLSAKMVGNNFYISQYENFPANFRKESEKGSSGASFIAVLRLCPKTKKFKLFSRQCECCDQVLGLMTCGAQSLHNGDRQLLLELAHLSSPVHCGYDTVIDCNVVKTKLPNVFSDLSRSCWCARFGKPSSNNGGVSENSVTKGGRSMPISDLSNIESDRDEACDANDRAALKQKKNKILKKKAETAPARMSGGAAELAAGNPHEGECTLLTRKPRFDRNSGSLRMKFLNNRVKEASSKNLIFYIDKNSHVDQLKQDAADGTKSVPVDDAVLQFGKACDNRFNLDYRFPLAPVQAFAMSLSLFKWQAGNDK